MGRAGGCRHSRLIPSRLSGPATSGPSTLKGGYGVRPPGSPAVRCSWLAVYSLAYQCVQWTYTSVQVVLRYANDPGAVNRQNVNPVTKFSRQSLSDSPCENENGPRCSRGPFRRFCGRSTGLPPDVVDDPLD